MKYLSLILSFFIILNYSSASTNISGQIRSNTTWTKAGSPYICSGMIEVDPNVTLTLEPGTVVVLDKDLQVYGKLVLQGTATDTISFSSDFNFRAVRFWGKFDSLNLSYCKFYQTFLAVENSFPNLNINHSSFIKSNIIWTYNDDRSKVDTGSLFIKNSLIDGSVRVLSYKAKILLEKNIHSGYVPKSFDGYSEGAKTVIKDNIFTNSEKAIDFNGSNTEIINNIFIKHQTAAISSSVGGATGWNISGNIFTNNPEAIFVLGQDINILNNSIYNNKKGITIYNPTNAPHNIIIENNCIYNNSEYNVMIESPNNYDLKNNWWGTTDTSIINKGMIDNVDDFKKGTIAYQPILSQSNPDCKIFPADPTSSKMITAQAKAEVTIAPNPFSQSFNINSSTPINQISILDVTGRKVYHNQNIQETTHSVDASNFPDGIYIYNIVLADNTMATGKIIKQ